MYDNVSDLMTHNISWYVESISEGINYRFSSDYYSIAGGCRYPNGTAADMVMIVILSLMANCTYVTKLPFLL